jgi:2,4-dienoyl-CoA reductase-like NADH-dependent reductase (Old Yellow Enzyme family)
MLKYYVQRAKGGAGLIVSEGILITRQGYADICSSSCYLISNPSTEWPYAPGIWEQAQIEGWKKITDAVHAEGSKIYAQVCPRPLWLKVETDFFFTALAS